jgi:thioredoxin reductase
VTVAIIGAGPYGLSIAAHLRSLGIPYRIFGTPVDTWAKHMPAGMFLKSDGFASSLSDPDGKGTLENYCIDRGIPYDSTKRPIPVELFVAYARAFQERFVPDLEERQVISIDKAGDVYTLGLDDGETLNADQVVLAVGITHFGLVPPQLAGLPRELMSHSSDHHDLERWAGRSVAVIGGGSSAIDLAVFLKEAGTKVTLVVRADRLRFASPPSDRTRTRWEQIKAPSSGLGPGWKSWVCENLPQFFRFLPGDLRTAIVRRHLGPAAGWPMKGRLEDGVEILLGTSIQQASEEDGRVRLVLRRGDGTTTEMVTDHVAAATGYLPDVDRLEFLSKPLRAAVRTHNGAPMVDGAFQTSVDGLYIVGPGAADSFGPLMRFMVGAEFVAPTVVKRLARHARRNQPTRRVTTA